MNYHSRNTGEVGQDSFSYKEETKQNESRLAVVLILIIVGVLIVFGMQ